MNNQHKMKRFQKEALEEIMAWIEINVEDIPTWVQTYIYFCLGTECFVSLE